MELNERTNMEEDTVICEECGQTILSSEAHEVDGCFYCDDCFENEFFVCPDCGNIHRRDEAVIVYDFRNEPDIEICEECSCSSEYCVCDDCGLLHHSIDTLEIEGDIVCDYCRVNGDYAMCEDCGDWFHTDSLYWNDRNEAYYCEDCYSNHEDYFEYISQYHDHDNPLEFFGDTKNDSVPYLGVELEVDNGEECDDCAYDTINMFPSNFIYMEEDGSLNNGFENITQPATLEYHMGLKETYQNMFKNDISYGFRSHNTSTCGLHVHFNRDFYKDNEDLYVTRLLYLVEKFWDELVKFSRRDITHLNRWAKKYNDKPEEVVKNWKTGWVDRYQAINLTNRTTIEFRMFRGTLKLNTFIATLQLVNPLILTAKNIESTEAIQSLKWEDLLQYDEVKAYWEEVKDRA